MAWLQSPILASSCSKTSSAIGMRDSVKLRRNIRSLVTSRATARSRCSMAIASGRPMSTTQMM